MAVEKNTIPYIFSSVSKTSEGGSRASRDSSTRLQRSASSTIPLGVDSGKVRFYSDTGRIVSDVINYAAHLEKAATEAGRISLSERTREKTDAKILTIFDEAGAFEGFPYVTTASRLDMLFALEEGCPGAEESA